ncbi:hypothetical protein GCM10007977_065670 [Dactylosporangium sucinum]|uniref:NADP-dependent oxidoreductase domain-containing protein n=1 Tax=Dactylosporangium sucinum TaxID=1424081 RepID=A0A917U4P0_9ACTN|nr:hypothetical protein GCM10007977_065670 [Dactylosporangium sucinum]
MAADLGRPMAQVAVNWAANRPGIGAVIVGASSPAQLDTNLGALGFDLPPEARQRLDEASDPAVNPPYSMFTPRYQSRIVSPGLSVGDKPAGYAPPLVNRA